MKIWKSFPMRLRKSVKISGRLLLRPNMDRILFRHKLLYGYNYTVTWFMELRDCNILLIGRRLVTLSMIINMDRLVWMVNGRKFMI